MIYHLDIVGIVDMVDTEDMADMIEIVDNCFPIVLRFSWHQLVFSSISTFIYLHIYSLEAVPEIDLHDLASSFYLKSGDLVFVLFVWKIFQNELYDSKFILTICYSVGEKIHCLYSNVCVRMTRLGKNNYKGKC